MVSEAPSRRQRRSERQRRLRWVAAGVVVVVVAAGAAVAIALSGGDGKERASTTATTGSGSTATTGTGPSVTTQAGGTPGTTGAPGGPCKGSDVSAETTGSRVQQTSQRAVVAITNNGRRACTVNGFPGVTLLGPNDEKLQAQVLQGGGAIPGLFIAKTVTVDPGGQASFMMAWNAATGTCLDVRNVELTLPGDTKSVRVKGGTSVSVCGGGTVNISPFQPGVIAS